MPRHADFAGSDLILPDDREDRTRFLLEHFDPASNRAFEPARWLLDGVPIAERRFPLTDDDARTIVDHATSYVVKAVTYGAWLRDLAQTLVEVGTLERENRDAWVEKVFNETEGSVVYCEPYDDTTIGSIIRAHGCDADLESWIYNHFYGFADVAARNAMGLKPEMAAVA